jgi:hypothetical protein
VRLAGTRERYLDGLLWSVVLVHMIGDTCGRSLRPVSRFGDAGCSDSSTNFNTFTALHYEFRRLLQLRVLRFGFFQDGDLGVGVFPDRVEVHL